MLVRWSTAWWPRGSGEAAAGGDTWTCSMHPQIRLPNPGRCPLCDMELIPVSKLPKARDDLEQRAGLVTEPIQRRELFKEIRTVGKLDYSERQVAYLTSRIAGRVDRVFADFTGIQVKKGDHLVEIYQGRPMFQFGLLVSRYKHDAPASVFSRIALAGAPCLYWSRRHDRDRATNWLALRDLQPGVERRAE